MLTKKEQRLRRSRQTRARISELRVARLTVFRSNLHIYASLISEDGAKVRLGRVTGLALNPGGTRATGVRVDDDVDLAADAVVLAMGPWSMSAGRWLPLPPVYGLKGNSVLFQTGEAVSADALFVEVATAGGMQTPEVFPRPDGTTYVCGLSSQQALPDDPVEVVPDPGAQEHGVDWLGQEILGTKLDAAHDGVQFLQAGGNDDWHTIQFGVAFQLRQHLKAVHDRHFDIQHHEVELTLTQERQRRQSVVRLGDRLVA